MENYSYSSYPDSHDSSPRSRDNESWEEQQPSSNYKVKFMCSYGGKILPRPHDNQLAYVGGETKILAVDRNIRFSNIISKLSALSDNDVSFKYQLPGEDLDALISVTNEEDLEHMMLEYDRLYRGAGSRPARLRLFLFPLTSSNQSSFSSDDPKPNQQWFVDALNSAPIQALDSSSPPASQDFLFGFEKPPVPSSPPPVVKLSDPKPPEIAVPEAKIAIGSDSGRDDRSDRSTGSDSMFEMHRQIQELQRLQIANQEQQAMFQRKTEGNINMNMPRAYQGDYYIPEKQPPAAVPAPATMGVPPASYWPDRQIQTSGYSDQIIGIERQQQQQQQHQQQQQVYLIPSQAGMYQTPANNLRQVTGQVGQVGPGGGGGGQGYYGMQRVVQDVYREQPVYSMGPPPPQQQMQPPPQPQMKMMMGGGDTGGGYTTQMAYDNTGRQVYYTTSAAPPGGGVVASPYQTAATATLPVDPRQAGVLSQEGKILKPPQASV